MILHKISFSLVLFSLATFTVSCTKKKPESVRLFYGACKVEVETKVEGSKIYVDGIFVGDDHASIEIPCGEKQVTVEKEGYVPYRAYLPATANQPLKVTVKLEREKHGGDYALSSELISQVRSGAPLINPHGSPEQKEFAVKYAELRKASDAASFKTAGASAGAASGGATVPAQSWDSVEDWR